jgi:hypothetical protein
MDGYGLKSQQTKGFTIPFDLGKLSIFFSGIWMPGIGFQEGRFRPKNTSKKYGYFRFIDRNNNRQAGVHFNPYISLFLSKNIARGNRGSGHEKGR